MIEKKNNNFRKLFWALLIVIVGILTSISGYLVSNAYQDLKNQDLLFGKQIKYLQGNYRTLNAKLDLLLEQAKVDPVKIRKIEDLYKEEQNESNGKR